jgi:RHS repeat-associated protein
MSGISSKAAGGVENKKKYNAIEFDNDLDLNLYEAFYRDLDPETGRFLQIDPKTEGQETESPYTSMANNPILKSDPLGDEAEGGPGDPPSVSTRIWGGVKAIGGLIEMTAGAVGGTATAWTGFGAVAGGVAVVHGADNVATGFSQMFSGTETKTFTEQGISKGLQATGVSEQKANTVASFTDGAISIALSAGSGAAANSSKLTSGIGNTTKELIRDSKLIGTDSKLLGNGIGKNLKGSLNTGEFRVGWGKHKGMDVLRIGIGNNPKFYTPTKILGKIIHKHIDILKVVKNP